MTLLYSVTREFDAMSAISGRIRRFKPGETLICNAKAKTADGSVTIEMDSSFFLVDRSIFKACCVFKNEGAPL